MNISQTMLTLLTRPGPGVTGGAITYYILIDKYIIKVHCRVIKLTYYYLI